MAPDIFTSLGILGTFIGLVWGLKNFQPTDYEAVSYTHLDVYKRQSSDCPCVQFYAGNFVKDEKGKNGHVYHERYGFCLETQVEPNAVNVEDFHSPILLPGEEYSSETVYRFFVK